MWYGFLSQTKPEAELNELYIVTPPYKTQEEALRALKAKEHRMMFWGNQKGAIKLEDEIFIGEKIVLTSCV